MSAHVDIELAEKALAHGEVEEAARLLRGVRPADLCPDELSRACLVLVGAGEVELARDWSLLLDDNPGRATVLRVLGDDVGTPADANDDDNDDDVRPPAALPAVDEAVLLFLRWLGGRRDLYAKQWYDEKRNRNGYHPVEAPLTEAVVRAHLAGRLTVGQYLLFPDATCSFGVIDLDVSASAMAEIRASHGDDASALRHGGLNAYARRITGAAASLGIPLFAEDSGNRGVHLWLFLEPRRPARAARAVLSQVLVAAGPQPPDVNTEIFPKQDALGRRGLSSLVKLPLGLHQTTMRRCLFLDDGLKPLEDPLEALRRLRPADSASVEAVIGRRVVALPAPEETPWQPPPALPVTTSARTLAEALRAVDQGKPEQDACRRMIEGCAILGSIVTRAYESHALTAPETSAVVYSLGLVGPACQVAEEVLAAARASNKELMRVRRGLPSPVGCAKLRRLVGGEAACHGCSMKRDAVPYASPTLLVLGDVEPAQPRHAPFAPWIENDQPVVRSGLDVVAEALHRIEERLQRLETKDGK
jgi:hypothetical protein